MRVHGCLCISMYIKLPILFTLSSVRLYNRFSSLSGRDLIQIIFYLLWGNVPLTSRIYFITFEFQGK